METKVCTSCKDEQDLENFHVSKKGKFNRASICKECKSKLSAKKIVFVPDLEGEVWNPFVGLEGIFVTSNKGRFKRIFNKRYPVDKLAKPFIHKDGDGYVQVPTCHLGQKTYHLAHRAVALAFIPNLLNLPDVNHKDGNKSNNCVENLEWCTKSENMKEAYRMGLAKSRKGEESNWSKLTEVQVLEIRAIGKSMKQKELSDIYGVDRRTISKIINRERWGHI